MEEPVDDQDADTLLAEILEDHSAVSPEDAAADVPESIRLLLMVDEIKFWLGAMAHTKGSKNDAYQAKIALQILPLLVSIVENDVLAGDYGYADREILVDALSAKLHLSGRIIQNAITTIRDAARYCKSVKVGRTGRATLTQAA